jgi:hypothetical protein
MYDFKEEIEVMNHFCDLEDWYEQEKARGNHEKAERIRKFLIKKEEDSPMIQVGHMILSCIDERRHHDKS